MHRDGSGLETVPPPAAVPGSHVVPTFQVFGRGRRSRRTTQTLIRPGAPENPSAGGTIQELFFFDGKSVVQLTDFRCADTAGAGALLTPDGGRAIFAASADPFGTNPSGTCQLFSIRTFGAGLCQLTHFSQPEYSAGGVSPGCAILPLGLDPATGIVVFYATSDPFGTNPYGDQLFVLRPDGALRQLTQARGLVTEVDDTVSAENIGPVAYSSLFATVGR